MYLPISDNPKAPDTVHALRAGEGLKLESLAGQHVADIVIIGGGIAGSSAALHAAEQGADVVLLEANEIGWGASSRNAGHVAPATKLSPQEVERRYGKVHGPRLNEAAENGPDMVFGLVEKHGIDASVVKSGVLVAAHTSKALKALEERAAYLVARGKPVEILDHQQAAKVIGSGFYLGAFLDRRGGMINPLAYVRGLARAASKAGARLYERSKVLRIEQSGSGWRVRTATGEVQARRVLICTNAYSDDLWPGLRQTIVPVRAYQLATTPLSPEVGKTVLPGRQPLTDTRRLLSGLRVNGDGRIHFGGIGPLFGKESRPDFAVSVRRLAEIFPQVEPIGIDRWWSGWMAMSSSNAWQLHELAPGVVTVLGCNGRGVAIATFLGREIANYAMGKPEKELVLPFTPLKKVPLHRFHQPLVRMLVRHHAIRDQMELRTLRRKVRALNLNNSSPKGPQ